MKTKDEIALTKRPGKYFKSVGKSFKIVHLVMKEKKLIFGS